MDLKKLKKDESEELSSNEKKKQNQLQLEVSKEEGNSKSSKKSIIDFKFWVEEPHLKIDHYALVKFLEINGIRKVREKSSGNYIMVSNNNGVIEEILNQDITEVIRNYLEHKNEIEVLRKFSVNVGNYVNTRLFEMLKTENLISDRDTSTKSYFYFKNKILIVNESGTKTKYWNDFKGLIWKNRIIDRDIEYYANDKGQFEKFCFNISKQNDDRFKALKTIIGYILHRHQDPANTRAIILVDEDISFDSTANGRRGKSLLCIAISKCRDVVNMSGKSIKSGSWFKNQRITRTTDIVWYDDVKKDFNFEDLYDTITSGMVVEKKHKDEFYIKPEDAPKTLISSNYIVRGTGGSSDRARRCEFEVASYYSEDFSPLDEFKNRFFTDWDDTEWNLFYSFMANCIKEYLANGLIIAEPINLENNRVITATTPFFVEFFNEFVEENIWIDNRKILNDYRSLSEDSVAITSNKFSRMMRAMAIHKSLIYESKSTGGNYLFMLTPNS